MVNVLILTHGTLADSLLDTLHLFLPTEENVTAISLRDEPAAMREAISAALQRGSEFLILVDLFGGTPFNIAASLLGQALADGKAVELISGVNLPMLLELLPNLADMRLPELAQLARAAGNDGIRDLMAELGKKN